jgi:hypothetical protein
LVLLPLRLLDWVGIIDDSVMMELQAHEKIIMQDEAKSDYFGKGILYMTNNRVILDVKTGGLLSKTTEVKLDKPLGTIKDVSAPGGKDLKIQFEGSVEPTTLYVANAEKWEAAIKSALTVTGKM